jgi:hypothetical protein
VPCRPSPGCVPMQSEDKVIDDVNKKLRGREHTWAVDTSWEKEFVRILKCSVCDCVKSEENLVIPVVTTECSGAKFVEVSFERIESGMLDYTEERGWHDPRNGTIQTSTT